MDVNATQMEIAGKRCVVLASDGPLLNDAGGARDIVEAALNEGARVVVVPASRLDPAFFELRSGFAGELLQKAANYRLTLAIVGDISSHVEASAAFRDFVIESNRGSSVFFEPDIDALTTRLAADYPAS